MKKNQYCANWTGSSGSSIANVSFEAVSDYHARLQSDKLARELNVINCQRTITKRVYKNGTLSSTII
jgi:hypothetical protein